jgi:hypothetical protein
MITHPVYLLAVSATVHIFGTFSAEEFTLCLADYTRVYRDEVW